jgi:hypothetical protein
MGADGSLEKTMETHYDTFIVSLFFSSFLFSLFSFFLFLRAATRSSPYFPPPSSLPSFFLFLYLFPSLPPSLFLLLLICLFQNLFLLFTKNQC